MKNSRHHIPKLHYCPSIIINHSGISNVPITGNIVGALQCLFSAVKSFVHWMIKEPRCVDIKSMKMNTI